MRLPLSKPVMNAILVSMVGFGVLLAGCKSKEAKPSVTPGTKLWIVFDSSIEAHPTQRSEVGDTSQPVDGGVEASPSRDGSPAEGLNDVGIRIDVEQEDVPQTQPDLAVDQPSPLAPPPDTGPPLAVDAAMLDWDAPQEDALITFSMDAVAPPQDVALPDVSRFIDTSPDSNVVVIRDAANTTQFDSAVPDVSVAIPQTPPTLVYLCPNLGDTLCGSTTSILSCTVMGWNEQACGNFQVCSLGSCRKGCDGLSPTSGTLLACHMPTEPGLAAAGPGQTTTLLVNDGQRLPSSSLTGQALDSRGTNATIAAPMLMTGQNPIWRTVESTTAENRLYVRGTLDLGQMDVANHPRWFTATITVKARRLGDSGRPAPTTRFLLKDAMGATISDVLSDFSPASPGTDWTLLSRTLKDGEISALLASGNPGQWSVWFVDPNAATIPQRIEIQWFAVSILPRQDRPALSDAAADAPNLDAVATPDAPTGDSATTDLGGDTLSGDGLD